MPGEDGKKNADIKSGEYRRSNCINFKDKVIAKFIVSEGGGI